MNEKRFITFFIPASFLLLVFCAFHYKGTVDSGDSVMHYLFARFAINHPASFLDPWAKPLYVALATPFAQLGFIGIKLFNCINTILSMLAAYLIAKRLNIKNSWLVPVLLLLAPMNFALSFSGLTEPLFASVLIVGLCFLVNDRSRTGFIILSFLPFVRSEGMFLLMAVALYLVIQKRYRSLIWLTTGQVVYAFIGYFHFKDLFWFYHNNPYSMFSMYGNGPWTDYFDNLPLIAGYATCGLLVAGFLTAPFALLKKERDKGNWQLMLIWTMFTMYFLFHVISWTFGLFGSFGMARIIVGVMPLAAILSVYGYNCIITLITPGLFAYIKQNYNALKPGFVFSIIMLVFGFTYGLMAIANHYFFRSTAFDFGPYNYAFWDYAHFHITPCPIYKVFFPMNVTFLQDHFSLLLMFLVPFYWLLNWLTGTYTLLLIQTGVILWGAWAIYKLVEFKTKDAWLAVGAVLYFFLLQGRYAAFDEDCNIIIMASCFVPLFLWFFESKRYVAALVIFIVAIFSREDMSLWFAFIPVVLIIWHRKERKLVYASLGYVVASIVCFVLIFKVFIPLVQSPDRKYDLFTYSALGKDPYDAFVFVLSNPIESFSLLFKNLSGNHEYDSVKMEFYMVYLVSGGFVLFYRPRYFIWFIPLIAQKMFNDEPIRWSIESYYSIQVATLLPVPVFIILAGDKTKWRYGLAVLVCALALTVTLYDNNPYNRKLGYTPSVKRNIFDSRFFLPGYDASAIHKDLKEIPTYASVSASTSILPHLAQRKHIYEFPDIENAQYIAALTTPDYYGMPPEQYTQELFNKYVFNSDWQILHYDAPFILLKKTYASNRANNYETITCGAETVSPDGKHLLSSSDFLVDNDSATLNAEHVRHGLHAVKLTKEKQFGMTVRIDKFTSGDFVLASVWRYSTNKDKGALVVSGNGMYLTSITSVTKDSAGWEQLSVFFIVPDNHQEIGVYIWDNSDDPVWFDDMELKRLKAHQ